MIPPPSPLRAALDYARRGWHVFPCVEGGKEPATPHGFKNATTDEVTIMRWWTTDPKRNVAIRTGAESGVFAIDEDNRNGGHITLEDLEAKNGPLPTSIRARSGSHAGRHILLVYPNHGRRVPSKANALGPGLDVKGDGGYILVAPSLHPSGNRYEWLDEEESALEEAPAWLLELACESANDRQTSGQLPDADDVDAPEENARRARAYLATVPEAISGQGGHEQTFDAALHAVRGFALSTRQAMVELEIYNARCKPPWTAKELRHKVDDARKNGRLPKGYLLEKGVHTVDVPPPPAADPVLIGDALEEPAPDIAWLIQDLLPVQAILLLAAHGGLGKTTLLVQLFACLAAGRDFLGFHVPQPVPVLYLIAEGARHVFLDRVRVALARLGMDPKALPLWVTPREFTPEIGAALESYIEKTRARLIGLDTVGLFHDGDENSASDFKAKVVKPLRAIMAKRDVSFVLVSHEGKPSQERKGRHRVRGTSAMVDDSDVAARLEAPEGDRATARTLIFEKVRTAAAPEPIALEFLPSFAIFERVGEEEIRERQEERSAETDARRLKDLEAQVVRYLRRDPDGLTKAELTSELHPRRADLVKVLDRLRDESRAFPDRDPKGRAMRWKLATVPRLEVAG